MIYKPRCVHPFLLYIKFLHCYPEGPARHLDASRQKLPPHCLAAIFDSQLPSSKLSRKMPPKLPLPHTRGHFFLFQNCPRGEGNCAAIERQKLSRGNFCLAASRCLSGPSGYLLKKDRIWIQLAPSEKWGKNGPRMGNFRAPHKGPENWCRAKIVEKCRNIFVIF